MTALAEKLHHGAVSWLGSDVDTGTRIARICLVISAMSSVIGTIILLGFIAK